MTTPSPSLSRVPFSILSFAHYRLWCTTVTIMVLSSSLRRCVTAFNNHNLSYKQFPRQSMGISPLSSLSASIIDGSRSRDSLPKPPPLILPKDRDNTDSPMAYTSVMAPMVAASDYPFRCLCRQYNKNRNKSTNNNILAFTQMLHVDNLLRDHTFVDSHLDLYECCMSSATTNNRNGNGENGNNKEKQEYLQYRESPTAQQLAFTEGDVVNCGGGTLSLPEHLQPFTKGPIIVQLAGNNPDKVVQAAHFLLEKTNHNIDGFDLNCGCPQNIARRGRYGAFLMQDEFKLVCDILTALRKSLPSHISVSVKMRLPLDDAELQYRIPTLMDTGINFLTIHGRTIKENKTLVRAVHTDRLRLAVETARACRTDFPVIANGGIEHHSDVANMMDATQASAIMSSEGLLELPNIFTFDSQPLRARPRFEQQMGFARDYLQYCRAFPPLHGVLGKHGSAAIVKGHLFKFLHRYLGEHQDLRPRLNCLTTLRGAHQFVDDLEDLYEQYGDDAMEHLASASPASSWYRRHREGMRKVENKGRHMPTSFDSLGDSSVVAATLTVEERKALIRKRLKKSAVLKS